MFDFHATQIPSQFPKIGSAKPVTVPPPFSEAELQDRQVREISENIAAYEAVDTAIHVFRDRECAATCLIQKFGCNRQVANRVLEIIHP